MVVSPSVRKGDRMFSVMCRLIDDDYSTLDKSVNRMVLEIQNTYNVINLNDYLALINNNDLS